MTDLNPTLLSGWHMRGYLPHLKVEGGTYFVTFRLGDSLPPEVLEGIRREREASVQRVMATKGNPSRNEIERLNQLYSERFERYLDAGRGECWLRRPEIGGAAAAALKYFEGERYHLHAWVVMPNHVHVVVRPISRNTLSAILQSWKSYTAKGANAVLGRAGRSFWQRESYDPLVRDEADLGRVCTYTLQNPVAAGLCIRPEDWPYSSVNKRFAT